MQDESLEFVNFDSHLLLPWCGRIFVAAGMRDADAATAADVLVRTSLRGIDTHGISRVPLYVDSLLSGNINPRPDLRAEDRDGVLHFHGDHGLGQATGVAAIRAAIDIAAVRPIVTCLVSQCGHLAALGTYVLIAAEAGMLAFICQATTPLMSLPGFKGRALGNNPLAFATPLTGQRPLVFDMAASVVARGNLRQSIREGTPVPPGWAVDPEGNPTTDAEAAWAGAMLPIGGYKGIGIAMLVQCLAGSLLGNSKMLDSSHTVASEMGAFLLVANPRLLGVNYEADIEEWLGRYKRAGGAAARHPGERAAESERQRLAHGIPIPPAMLGQLRATGERLGVPFPEATSAPTA